MTWNGVQRRSEVLAVAGDGQGAERTPIFLRGAFMEEEGELPPRLTPLDLSHPEFFHQRLAAWLMKQH
ncbi:MAG: hypothetical protein IPL96_00440 [Holophagaceae bacterium]|nr:hypothetical protein [Holophagaceae bacterium]